MSVKRYRLSYRHGVISDVPGGTYLADASEPMVLASDYELLEKRVAALTEALGQVQQFDPAWLGMLYVARDAAAPVYRGAIRRAIAYIEAQQFALKGDPVLMNGRNESNERISTLRSALRKANIELCALAVPPFDECTRESFPGIPNEADRECLSSALNGIRTALKDATP